MDRLDSAAEADQHAGVDGVGLGEDARGAGKVADLAGIDADGGEPLLAQVTQGTALVATGGLEHDAGRGPPGQSPRKSTVAPGLVGKLLDGSFEPEGHVQGRLGDVDTHDGRRIDHGLALSCDAGVISRENRGPCDCPGTYDKGPAGIKLCDGRNSTRTQTDHAAGRADRPFSPTFI